MESIEQNLLAIEGKLNRITSVISQIESIYKKNPKTEEQIMAEVKQTIIKLAMQKNDKRLLTEDWWNNN